MKPATWTGIGRFKPERPVDSEGVLKRLARTGWRYVELSMEDLEDIDKRDNPEREFKALKRLCTELGISIPQMHGPVPDMAKFSPVVSNQDEYIKVIKRSLRWASILGVKWVVLHPGGAYWSDDERMKEKLKEGNLKFFSQILKYAESFKVGIAIENLTLYRKTKDYKCFGATPSELLWLVSNLDSKWVGICWDTGHANGEDLDQYQALKIIGKHLVATHINDNDSFSDQHRLPFEGTINWEGVMQALRDIGYSGLFNLEVGGTTYCLRNNRMPVEMKEDKLRYILKLTEYLIKKEPLSWK
ncbi:sugar phosphate isomerase/epimerase [Candidatus Aerophobetes bacterium]|nr:sugar phosphate isomerase/epimerase [Candidatus Aerophobetes bacterium]